MKQHLHALEALAAELESRGLEMPAYVTLYANGDYATASAIYHGDRTTLPADIPWGDTGGGIPVVYSSRDDVDIVIQAAADKAVAA